MTVAQPSRVSYARRPRSLGTGLLRGEADPSGPLSHLQLLRARVQLARAACCALLAHRHAPVLQVIRLPTAAARRGAPPAAPNDRRHLVDPHERAADLVPEVIQQVVPTVDLQARPAHQAHACAGARLRSALEPAALPGPRCPLAWLVRAYRGFQLIKLRCALVRARPHGRELRRQLVALDLEAGRRR